MEDWDLGFRVVVRESVFFAIVGVSSTLVDILTAACGVLRKVFRL